MAKPYYHMEEFHDRAMALGLESAHFDDIIHEIMNKRASIINNGGIDIQLRFLVREVGSVEAYRVITELGKEKQNGKNL